MMETIEEEVMLGGRKRFRLAASAHLQYLESKQGEQRDLEHWITEHLYLSGLFWGLNATLLLGEPNTLSRDFCLDKVLSCQHPNGGFGGHTGHDPHILYTLSALQILVVLDELHQVDADKVAAFVCGLQQPDGSFAGDEWGEVDSRFAYCALYCLAILGRLGQARAAECAAYLRTCQNLDGGFGLRPGAESHSGQTFCCLAALTLAGERVDPASRSLLVGWLCERQLLHGEGGMNGRPEKRADTCYAWWVTASLSLLGCEDRIDRGRLLSFLEQAQCQGGGLTPHLGKSPDVFHTHFGLAALALLRAPGLQPVSALFCLPQAIAQRIAAPGAPAAAPPPASPTTTNYEATLRRGANGMGFRLARCDGDGSVLVVSHLQATSPADKQGIRNGDVLVSINGVATKGAEHFKAVKLLKGGRGPKRLLFSRSHSELVPLEPGLQGRRESEV